MPIISREKAQYVWDILVRTCGAPESMKEDFLLEIQYGLEELREYRFQGSLGFGGKIWFSHQQSFYVTCYKEDETPERLAAIQEANKELAPLQYG